MLYGSAGFDRYDHPDKAVVFCLAGIMLDMSEIAETAKALVSPLEKLIEVAGRAFGVVYEPRHIRKIADAKAYEISKVSSAIKDSGLKVSYNGGVLIDSEVSNLDDVKKRAVIRVLNTEARKQENLERVFDGAYAILSSNDEKVEPHMDYKWVSRFMEAASEADTEELTGMWSRILSGEIRRSGSFSIRTIECVRNISTEEARMFADVMHICMQFNRHVYLPNEEELLDKYGISYGNILTLGECGLISSQPFTSLVINFAQNSEETPCIIGGNILIRLMQRNDAKSNEIQLRQFPLTTAGTELYWAVNGGVDDEFTLGYAQLLKKKYSASCVVTAHEIVSRNSGVARYKARDVLD